MSDLSDSRASIAQHYHERTKYAPETIAASNRGLDWNTQPQPYKEYKLGKVYDLKTYLNEEIQVDRDGLLTSRWRRLSHLLFCSYGLTARVQTITGESIFLRAAPSAGGLYPAEVYLISGGTPILPAGLYNYQTQSHSLIHFWEDNSVWDALKKACLDNPILEHTRLAIATTAIFFRSAWRYQDRAYRRICLDTGHLLGNIELACALNGFRPYLIGGFDDEAVNQLLYLDVSQEGAISIVPLMDVTEDEDDIPTTASSAVSSQTITEYPRIPDGQLLEYLHLATQIYPEPLQTDSAPDPSRSSPEPEPDLSKINQPDLDTSDRSDKYNFPFCTKISTVSSPIDWGEQLEGLENSILRRRSTRAYSGAHLDLGELNALLDFTYQPHHYVTQGLSAHPDYFDLSLIETFIAVSVVTGLEEGCYYYAPKAQELRQIRFKNFRQELHYLCLGQDLGRDAAAVLFHTADLNKAVAKYGDRVYRYLHMDAGHLGQRLNLAAIHLGLGASGIGGFFDDRVNEVLGIPVDEAVVYITTLGRPAYLYV
jgi:SagB-type dehydrogenase family enzyme